MGEMIDKAWRSAAGKLAARLGTDKNHAQAHRNPWWRAASSMVVGWGIRLSRPPAKGNMRVVEKPDWKSFARWAMGNLAMKANRARKSDWYLWATRRVSGGSRYIPKSKRDW